MHTMSQLKEIASELRKLQKASPTHTEGLAAWYKESRHFSSRLSTDYAGIDLPEEIWHYLHDADLRVKDPSYKQLQDEKLVEVIANLERGIVPERRGSTTSLHPRWLGVVGLLLVMLVLYWVAR